MSTPQFPNDVGNFNKAFATPYSASLGELLNLYFNESKLQIQNREVERVIAEEQGEATKAIGEAEEQSGDEDARRIRFQADAEIAQGATGIATIGSPIVANKLAKSNTLSFQGEELKGLDNEIETTKSWDSAFNGVDSKLEVGNVPRGYHDVELPEAESAELGAKLKRLEGEFNAGKPFSGSTEDLELAHQHKQAEFNELRGKTQTRLKELEKEKADKISSVKQSHAQQVFVLFQGTGQAISGLLNNYGAASATEAKAEQDKLKAQLNYAAEQLKQAQQSLERQSTDLDSAKQNLAQILGNIARISNAA